MGFAFWRRARTGPPVSLELLRGVRAGPLGHRGGRPAALPPGGSLIGSPAASLFWKTTIVDDAGPAPGEAFSPARPAARPDSRRPATAARRLSLGWFARLVTPPHEREVLEGSRLLLLGQRREARACLEEAVHVPDGAFLAGFLALEAGDGARAVALLESTRDHHRRLGASFGHHHLTALLELSLTGELAAHFRPGLRGSLLGLTLAHDLEQQPDEALRTLESLRSLVPEDPVVRLALCERMLAGAAGPAVLRRVVRLSEEGEPEGQVGAALMLYHARALLRLGLPEAARETLNLALRRRRGRSPGLQRALRYERVLVYERLGKGRRARADLERLYAEDPAYEDVAERLDSRQGGKT